MLRDTVPVAGLWLLVVTFLEALPPYEEVLPEALDVLRETEPVAGRAVVEPVVRLTVPVERFMLLVAVLVLRATEPAALLVAAMLLPEA